MPSIAYKNKSREQRREKQKSSWGEKVRKRTEKRQRETGGQSKGKGLGLEELLIMVQTVILMVLISLLACAHVISHDRIHSAFWFGCFWENCVNPSVLPDSYRMRV